MSEAQKAPASLQPGPDWTSALPENIPEPTLWPAFVGVGSTLLVWGLISSLIISGIGLAVFAIAIRGWIGNLRHERLQKQRTPNT